MNLIIDLINYNGKLPYTGMSLAAYLVFNILGLIFFIMYIHQYLYLILGTFFRSGKKIAKTNPEPREIGIVISARNESRVIGKLIESIQANDYPMDKVMIFVIADNCTDDTAEICRNMGCVVFERNDLEHIGKGYALNYLFTRIHAPEYEGKLPEAYIVLDADNVIKRNYITEMNKTYCAGYDMVTSYRNSKNFCDNWISAGYGYWFLHEARHLNNSRMLLHTSCAISGTGFLISKKVVEEFDNWKFFTLTEDIQCSTEYALTGRNVGYCDSAELYDEQPVKFSQSLRQRERWAKGFYQVFGLKGGELTKGILKGKFACWDILTTIFPAIIVTLLTLITVPVLLILCAIFKDGAAAIATLEYFGCGLVAIYVIMFVIALLVAITDWKKIHGKWYKKILYLFTQPLYMATYIPVAITALFKKVTWKPIEHKASMSLDDVEKAEQNK